MADCMSLRTTGKAKLCGRAVDGAMAAADAKRAAFVARSPFAAAAR